MKGTLEKASDNKKKWAKKWVQLEGTTLSYHAKQGKPADALVDLHAVKSVKGTAIGKKKFTLVLETNDRDWCFSTGSQSDVDAWVAAVQKEIDEIAHETELTLVYGNADETGLYGDVVDNIDGLTEECQGIINGMEVGQDDLTKPENYPILLSVLTFQCSGAFRTSHPNPYLNDTNSPLGGTVYSTDAVKAARRFVQNSTERHMTKLFKEENKLGEGGYGIVYRGLVNKDKSTVAIKKCKHVEDNAVKSNMREAYYLNVTDSPYIVKVFAAYVLSDLGEMWTTLEFMEGGTLTQARKLHVWSQDEIGYITRELFKGVEYLHSIDIIHRDIKSGNVMMTVKGEVKLIDFGLASNIPKEGQKLRGIVGSPFWIPPEMIRGLTHNTPADIWSSAACLRELVDGYAPHRDKTASSGSSGARAMYLIGIGTHPPYVEPEKWTDDLKTFFERTMEFNADTRATATEALAHPFCTSNCAEQPAMEKMLIGVFQGAALSMF